MATKPGDSINESRVYYIRLDMEQIRSIYSYYVYEEPNIRRINAIKSHHSFGSGYFLEWAGEISLEDDARYDYKRKLQSLLETARQWHDMVGFVAFVDMRRARLRARQPQAQASTFKDDTIIREKQLRRIERDARESERLLNIPKRSSFTNEPLGEPVAGERAPMGVQPTTNGQMRDGTATSLQASSAKVDQTRLDAGGVPPATRVLSERSALAAKRKREEAGGASKGTTTTNATALKRSKTASMPTKARRAPDDDVVENEEERRIGSDPRMSIEDLLSSFDSVRILDPFEGTFFLEVDPILQNKRIVFVPNTTKVDAGAARMLTSTANSMAGVLRQVDYDKSVNVYVWDGRMPDSRGQVQTPFTEPIRLRAAMRESEENTLDADYAMAHPTMFIETGRQQGRLGMAEDMTETALYARTTARQGIGGVSAANSMTPKEQQVYKRNMRESIMLEAKRDAFNHSVIHGQASSVLGGRAHYSVPGDDGRSKAAQRRRTFDQTGLFELPPGMAVGKDVKAGVIASAIEWRTLYKTELASVLGVPRDFVEGSTTVSKAVSGKSRSGAAGGDSSLTSDLIRTTVVQDREDLARFFEEMWDTLHRPSDNVVLSNRLAGAISAKATVRARLRAARDQYDAIVEESSLSAQQEISHLDAVTRDLSSEQARFDKLRKDIENVLQLQFRMRIRFHKTVALDVSEIEVLGGAGALSRIEEVNMMRVRMGLPEITRAELAAIDDERLSREAVRAERLGKIAADTQQKMIAPSAPSGNQTTKRK